MKKNDKVSIEELTDYEIFKIETQNTIAKYEKELAKNKKIIANLKSRDRVYAKAIALCESKINNVKQDSMDKLLFLCENIKDIRKSFYKNVEKLESEDLKKDFLQIGEEYEYMLNSIYNVCNIIEEDAVFTKADKELISTKFDMSDLSRIEDNDQFEEMKNEIRKNISKKGKTLNDQIQKDDESDSPCDEIVYEDSESKLSEQESKVLSDKFNEMFYGKPTEQKVISNIKPTEKDGFDFNEALNPTMSLSDIMQDLMPSNGLNDSDADSNFDDELAEIEKLSQKEETNNLQYRQKRIQKIENKMAQNSKFEKRDDTNEPYIPENDEKNKKEDYEKRFTYLQNIFKNLNK